MSHIILSNKPQKEYTDLMAESLELFSKENIDCIAVSARTTDGKVLTGYWHAGLDDKAVIAQNIQFDAIDEMIQANRERYMGED